MNLNCESGSCIFKCSPNYFPNGCSILTDSVACSESSCSWYKTKKSWDRSIIAAYKAAKKSGHTKEWFIRQQPEFIRKQVAKVLAYV